MNTNTEPTPEVATDHFGKALHKTCKVLIALHDHGPMTTKEIEDLTGIDHAGTICSQLAAKLKIRRQNPLAKSGYIWEAIPEDEFEPNPRPRMVVNNVPRLRSIDQAVSRRIKMDKSRNALRPTFLSVSFRDKKISLLRDLAEKTGNPTQKDLIIGMIADYEGRA